MRTRPLLTILAGAFAAALLATLLAALPVAGPARADTLITALSTHRVLIGSNYTGAQIGLFGTVERNARSIARSEPYDIVVTVSGPRRHLLVREKERQGPLWLNSDQRRFVDAPSYLSVMTTRPISEMGSEEDARRLRIGLRNVLAPAAAGMSFDVAESRFTSALLRIKGAEGLYAQIDRGVTYLTPGVFRASIVLPATAPTGSYDVTVELISGGVPLSRQQTNFEVVQIGFEQQVASVARGWPLLYGLGTALAALLFGWLATVIFRRD
jgi:uncharacterized protein (TIGR02186 family)